MEETVEFITNDGEHFTVDVKVAKKLNVIKEMFDDLKIVNSIPLPEISSMQFKKVIEYAKYDLENPIMNENTKENELELSQWETNFCNMEKKHLFEIILAANFLDYNRLLEITCFTVAKYIKGKTVEQIRQTFGIVNDFTEKELEDIKKENDWVTD